MRVAYHRRWIPKSTAVRVVADRWEEVHYTLPFVLTFLTGGVGTAFCLRQSGGVFARLPSANWCLCCLAGVIYRRQSGII